MPSVFSHAAPALALAPLLPAPVRKPFLALGIVGAALPDLDVLAFRFGVPYAHALGHRGLSHSLAFAAGLAALVVWQRLHVPGTRSHWGKAWLFLFVCIASHGVLDAATNGGLGVALFAPFDATRWFLPWRPIEVSPLGVSAFFSTRGLEVLRSEALWVWSPCLGIALALVRRATGWGRA